MLRKSSPPFETAVLENLIGTFFFFEFFSLVRIAAAVAKKMSASSQSYAV